MMDMNDLNKRRTELRQGDHGVDLDALRSKLDKLHSIPQLEAGVNGKLRRVAPKPEEPKPLSEEQVQQKGIEALAKCVAQAEGDFIDATIRKIFRDDGIGMSYNRRFRMMHEGNIKPMADMLRELEIEINHGPPEEGYELPEGCILYRHLIITKAGKIRGERVWEWSGQA